MGIEATRTTGDPWSELAEVDSSVPEQLSSRALENPNGVAVFDAERSLTWVELEREVASAARRLLSLGVGRGDVVTMQLPNWWETITLSIAVWRIGAVLNPVTPIYRGTELRIIFALAKPSLVLFPGRFGETDYETMTQDALTAAGIVCPALPVRPDSEIDSFFATEENHDSEGVETKDDLDAVSLLMFTSGTTGMPKGVLHNARTLIYEAASISRRFNLQAPTVFMPSPITHITGLLYGLILPMLSGGRVVLQDRWNPAEAVDLIESQKCTFCVGATPFLVGLTNSYEELAVASSLDVFVCGGADVPPEVIGRAQRVMDTRAVRAYGLTELPTLTCGSAEDELAARAADDGALIGSARARIADGGDGVGELEAKAPEMFIGYLDPRDNEGAFTDDGWFKTGDLAQMFGDRILIKGRKKDIICRGGENISPLEIENLLLSMPGIADVAVVGVADSVLGERACAMVVSESKPPSLKEIGAFLKEHDIAIQKFPEYVLMCDELPRTASGKIQKFRLRREAEQRIALGEGESR